MELVLAISEKSKNGTLRTMAIKAIEISLLFIHLKVYRMNIHTISFIHTVSSFEDKHIQNLLRDMYVLGQR